jgi:hypothetical protein
MLVFVKLVVGLSARSALSGIRPAFLLTHPSVPRLVNRHSRMPLTARVNGAGNVLPVPLDQVIRLGHKLVYVVVVAVVYAVDVA